MEGGHITTLREVVDRALARDGAVDAVWDMEFCFENPKSLKQVRPECVRSSNTCLAPLRGSSKMGLYKSLLV